MNIRVVALIILGIAPLVQMENEGTNKWVPKIHMDQIQKIRRITPKCKF